MRYKFKKRLCNASVHSFLTMAGLSVIATGITGDSEYLIGMIVGVAGAMTLYELWRNHEREINSIMFEVIDSVFGYCDSHDIDQGDGHCYFLQACGYDIDVEFEYLYEEYMAYSGVEHMGEEEYHREKKNEYISFSRVDMTYNGEEVTHDASELLLRGAFKKARR